MEIVDRGKQMREVNLVRNHRRRLFQWRDNVIALKEYKKRCSISIQLLWRCYFAKKRKNMIMQRMRNANKKFFFLCEFHHNLYRLEIFKEWTRLMRITRSHRCASILSVFIRTSERRKKFYWAGDKLRNLLRIRKKHTYRVVMRK
jgi:hypothetical protein